jgi:superfamily II DNA or RNA helicase
MPPRNRVQILRRYRNITAMPLRWNLKPLRREAPVCESYDDATLVLDFERDMRTHRAYAEPFRIEMQGTAVDDTFRVSTERGTTYWVDIMDGSGALDACSCPDFVSNRLGTCKHLEAVRRLIASVPRLAREYEALPNITRKPVLTVRAAGELDLVLAGKHAEQRFAEIGGKVRGGTLELPDPLPASSARLRVAHAVSAAARELQERRARARRSKAVEADVKAGRLGLDVLRKPLFPYQRDGVAHLVRAGRAMLADDMGLGKTVQAIAACEVLRARGEARRILVVCPASLKAQWAREIEKYAGARAVVLSKGAKERRTQLDTDAPYTVLNYELTWRDLSILQTLEADVLVLDEAQRGKNFRTKTSETLRAIPSRFSFVLTGTPVENRLDDLYGLMQLVEPRVLGPLWQFNLEFHRQSERGRIEGYKNLARLRERVAPYVLRRRKEEVLTQLPPLTEQTRFVALTPAQEELDGHYRRIAAQLMQKAARQGLSPVEQKRLLAALLKARQACNAVQLCDPKAEKAPCPKLDEFEQLVQEIVSQGTGKIIVFSEWTEMLHLCAARLRKLNIGHVMLHGGIKTDTRPALLDRFRDDDDLRVLLSTDAGGTGLNLQVANYVIHMELPWNPARIDQRTARAHRLGQTRGVSAFFLCSEEGIERGIEATLGTKRQIRAASVDLSSDVDEMDAPSFMAFLREVQAATAHADSLDADIGVHQEFSVDAKPSPAPAPAVEPPALPEVTSAPALAPAATAASRGRSEQRLRLAKVVLHAGFPGDAVSAAYDALATALRALSSGPVGETHAALVATLYRELLPNGRIPADVGSLLARAHDLTLLEREGVPVDPALAATLVGETEDALGRLATHAG